MEATVAVISLGVNLRLEPIVIRKLLESLFKLLHRKLFMLRID